MNPIVFDLYAGLGGWSEAFIAEGYRAVGFDIERHDYGNGGYPGELVLRDVRSITGPELVREFGVPAIIVASPPCQEFSYMAMPWSKAKAKEKKIASDPAEQKRLTDLFNQCFRIQREVSEAAGHYIPLIVENVRGAQKWVGKAQWRFGSFFLWGDVPALMPIPAKIRLKAKISCAPRRFDCGAEGTKQPGIGGVRDNGKGDAWFQNGAARSGSRSNARKQASAEIAKIPFALASWIARTFKPVTSPEAPRAESHEPQ